MRLYLQFINPIYSGQEFELRDIKFIECLMYVIGGNDFFIYTDLKGFRKPLLQRKNNQEKPWR